MRAVWLVAVCLLVAGCGSQSPAPPPGDDADTSPDETDESSQEPSGSGDGGSSESDDGTTNDTTNETTNESDEMEETAMEITSPAFDDGETIPAEHTEDGADTSPPLNVSDVPADSETLALIVDDPDAPRSKPWVHWLIWNIPAQADTIPEGYPPSGDGKAFDQARQGTNSFSEDNQRYRGPAPPPRHDAHRYRFTLFAVDTTLDLEEGANRTQLDAALDGHVLEQARLTGLYDR